MMRFSVYYLLGNCEGLFCRCVKRFADVFEEVGLIQIIGSRICM